MLAPFMQGFGAGGGLIVAIGAQNAFVLSQGVRKNFHITIALICMLCDAVFISAGVAGFGKIVAADPVLSRVATLGGAGFLFYYGLGSLRSALRGGSLETDDQPVRSLGAAVLTTLAVTLLNPHVYLDTIILLGGISSRFFAENRLYFGAGAISASVLWFLCLSLGGQMLAPLFKKPISWRILDSLVCATMWGIAVSLVLENI